ncbi:MAG TPA: hypothetical protein PKC43_08150 [Phycisphaerales bacterium]|nr:hypothetical protein [Phycisphaerales bacterium]HMP37408.1 hypothetical protein [Phycisphaerales bacterium]
MIGASAAIGAALVASHAGADEDLFDVWLRLVETAPEVFSFETGAITEGDPGDPIAERWRVFPAELGEDPLFPFSATEPGFQLLASPETANQILFFTITTPVLRWTGTGFVAGGEIMEFGFGPALVFSGAGPVPGFQFSANAQGFIHDHFDQTLFGPGATDPDPGIYLVGLSMEGLSPLTIAASETFYYCYNLETDEEEWEGACAWADLYVACTLDLNGDGVVDGADLGALLANYGKRGDGGGLGDLNRDGIVDGADLGLLLGGWAHVCP